MTIRRYARAPIINGGLQYGTSFAIQAIRNAIAAGSLTTSTRTLQAAERLDVIAGQVYGDARNWWIIAAASNIGWMLQAPPGTRIVIPTDLSQISDIVG